MLYPHLITQMQNAPNLHIHVDAAPQTRIIEGVLSGSFNLGITDHVPENLRLSAIKVGRDALCLVLPETADPDPDFETLQALGFIDHPDGAAYAETLLTENFPNDYKHFYLLHTPQLHQTDWPNSCPRCRRYRLHYLAPQRHKRLCRTRSFANCCAKSPVQHDLWLISRKARDLPAREDSLRQLLGRVL